jgi:periplasmic protein TonB
MAAVQTRPLGALGRMGVVVAAHGALVFILATSFGLVPKDAVPPDVTLVPVDDPPIIDDDPPPLIGPSLTSERPQLPAPENPPVDNSSENVIGAELVEPDRIVTETGPGSGPVITGAAVDPRRPLSQPPYPARLQREGVEGAVDVEVFVQPDGRIGDARIVRSSGYAEFDQVTLDEARRRWRMVPATADGRPITQWYRLRVKFKLTNR